MDNILKDKRFAHIAKDPKFRKIPKNEHKVKIDKRFLSMFKDKKFSVKYTVDKRGRPINHTSAENLRKYYDISSSEEDSFPEESKESEYTIQKYKFTKSTEISKRKKDEIKNKKNKIEKSIKDFCSHDTLLLTQYRESTSELESNNNSDKKINIKTELIENRKQIKTEKKLDNDVKKKLQDLSVDYARGKGVLLSNSSSDESFEFEDDEQEIYHNWGELDKETQTAYEVTNRLAVCNMDWDRIRAIDLMVLFNSFLPTGGLIDNVTIYPSEFGLQRMKEEELKGPIELIEAKNKNLSENDNKNTDSENEEGMSYDMEKLRQYQLNRLKYYYAVIVFDSATTANKIYTECDGLEYESSSIKLDLRFIPNNMTFFHEPKEFSNELPDLVKYKPRKFTTTALQQVKVDLTWDETNPERQDITQKLKCGKFGDLDENDIQAYLATGSSEDEYEDKVKKQLEEIDSLNVNDNPIDKYKLLIKSIEQAEEEKKDKEVELEFTWGLDIKEKTEKLVKEKIKKYENLTPFQNYLEKRKIRKLAKRAQQKRNLSKDNDTNESDIVDSTPSKIDIKDPYFSEDLKNIKQKSRKPKNTYVNDDLDFTDKEEGKKGQAELELLLMDENEKSNKYHFSMKRIEESQFMTKSKKKRLIKNKTDLKEEANKDNFKINVKDPRFNALFTSHHYNIDPADSHYRKTKGTEALVQEKLKRRIKIDTDIEITQEFANEEKNFTNSNVNAELNTLIRSIKRNSQNLKTSKINIA